MVATGGVEIVTPAQPPVAKLTEAARGGALGLAAGLVGLGIAFARDSLDDALSSKEAAEVPGRRPGARNGPDGASWKKRKRALVVSTADPTSPAAEAYRSLRTALQFIRHERGPAEPPGDQPGRRQREDIDDSQPGRGVRPGGRAGGAGLLRPAPAAARAVLRVDEQVGLTTVLRGEQSLERRCSR